MYSHNKPSKHTWAVYLALVWMLFVIPGAVSAPGDTTIAKWKDNKRAAFSLNFDDSSVSQATIAIPEMIERGIVGSFYCNPDHSSWYDYPEVWTGTAVTSGQELAGHTMTHGDWSGNKIIEDYANAEWEIGENARIIWAAYEKHYPGYSKLHSWCFPGGGIEWRVTDQELEELFNKYHFVNRLGVTCAVTGESANSLYRFVQSALNSGGWGGVCFHGIEGMDYAPVSRAEFNAFLDKLLAVGDELWVGTNVAVYKYIKERDSARAAVVSSDASQIRLSLTSDMDSALYDEPLTLITEVPSSWLQVTVTQGGKSQECDVSGGKVQYYATPGKGEIVLQSGSGGGGGLTGDVNSDGRVDIFDLVIVAQNFGLSSGFDSRADLNSDGRVDIFDLVIVAQHFGETG